LIGVITIAFGNTNIDPLLEDVMTRKICDTDHNSSMLTATTVMHSRKVGSIIVNNSDNKFHGIFT